MPISNLRWLILDLSTTSRALRFFPIPMAIISHSKYTSNLLSCARLTDNKVWNSCWNQSIPHSTWCKPLSNCHIISLAGWKSCVLISWLLNLISLMLFIESATLWLPLDPHILQVSLFFPMSRVLYFTAYISPIDHPLYILHAYTNANWIGDLTNHCSTAWFCFLFGDSLISRRSKKHLVFSYSNNEAEYRALVDANSKLIKLHWLL